MQSFMKWNLVLSLLLVGSLACHVYSAEKKIHLLILSGQSNMAGLNHKLTFVPTITKAFPDDEIIAVKSAQGGQPIRRWYKKWEPAARERTEKETTGDLYEVLMKRVAQAVGDRKPDTITFIWMQGESDARGGNAEVYAESFNGLMGQLRDDLKRKDIGFVIGRISDCRKNNAHWDKVRQAQVDVADKDPLGTWVDTDDLNGEKDGLHYNKEGYAELGTRFAKEAAKLIKGKN